jgi:hypothetical protein
MKLAVYKPGNNVELSTVKNLLEYLENHAGQMFGIKIRSDIYGHVAHITDAPNYGVLIWIPGVDAVEEIIMKKKEKGTK